LDTIICISDEFLTPAAATRAQQSLEKVQYSSTLGIRTYVRELKTLCNHIFMPIDEYTLRRQIVAAIPQTICHWLINYKDLSISTSTVVEWVDAIERHERELLEREAYNASVSALVPKRPALGLTQSRTVYDANNAHMPSKNTTHTGISDGTKSPINNGTMPKNTTTP
jgi:hypothetical protein